LTAPLSADATHPLRNFGSGPWGRCRFVADWSKMAASGKEMRQFEIMCHLIFISFRN